MTQRAKATDALGGALICMSKCDLPAAPLCPPPDHDKGPRMGTLEAGGVRGRRGGYCSRARHHGEIRIIGLEGAAAKLGKQAAGLPTNGLARTASHCIASPSLLQVAPPRTATSAAAHSRVRHGQHRCSGTGNGKDHELLGVAPTDDRLLIVREGHRLDDVAPGKRSRLHALDRVPQADGKIGAACDTVRGRLVHLRGPDRALRARQLQRGRADESQHMARIGFAGAEGCRRGQRRELSSGSVQRPPVCALAPPPASPLHRLSGQAVRCPATPVGERSWPEQRQRHRRGP